MQPSNRSIGQSLSATQQVSELDHQLSVPYQFRARHVAAEVIVDEVEITAWPINEVVSNTAAEFSGTRVVLEKTPQRHSG